MQQRWPHALPYWSGLAKPVYGFTALASPAVRSDRLLYQAKLALDDTSRLKVVRKMYELRFGEKSPERRSIEQLRGIEGARVRKMYELLAQDMA